MDLLDVLKQRFSVPSAYRRVVFWHDPDGEQDFGQLASALQPLGAKVWEWTMGNAFRTKVQLEVEDPESSYLVYARFARPTETEDWLLDVRLYGETFVADETALLMERLQVTLPTTRAWLQAHRTFFRSQERIRKVERLLPENPREDQLIVAVVAVAVGVDALDIATVVRRVLALGLSHENHMAYSLLEKWQLDDDFWQQVGALLGVSFTDPTLADLFDALVASHLQQGLDSPLPCTWDLPSSRVPNTCCILLDDALRSADADAFATHLNTFATRYGVIDWLSTQPFEVYARCDTLPEIHALLLRQMAADLLHGSGDRSRLRPLLVARKSTREYAQYAEGYEAIEQSLTLQEESDAFAHVSAPPEPLDWIQGYASRWFRIDQAYRRLGAAFEALHQPDWLSQLKGYWDRWYTYTFLLTYGEWTDQAMELGLAERWPVMGALQQRAFFSSMVSEHLSRERVFVILSDALRFEAGQELAARLKPRLNADVEIQPMQAVLPTYTRLGMASLLPGKTLTLEETGAILCEDLRTDGLEARNQLLAAKVDGAMAQRLPEFLSLPVQEGESRLRGKRLIYLYHDVIDATGDQAKSETRTFLAVREALDDLTAAVDKLVRSYRAVRIVITSDHGFLYQPGAVEAWAKPTPVEGTVYDGNRRFALGRSLSAPPGTRRVSLRYLGWEEVEAVVATSIHRLTVRGGGQRFVHGGAMPQEAIVPVITYRQIRGQSKVAEQARVDVTLANRGRLVTSYTFTALLFQEQKVSDALFPRNLRIALYANGTRISSEVTRLFDATGPADQREVSVVLHLFERAYPLGTAGFLRLEDVSGPETVLYAQHEIELRIVTLN